MADPSRSGNSGPSRRISTLSMFNAASAFNQEIEGVSNVTEMSFMLSRASAFNQLLEAWDVSSVKHMDYIAKPNIAGIINLLILSVSVFVVTQILPSVRIKGFSTAVVVALIYGVLKVLLTKILVLVSFPLMVITLGLFYLVINAFLLWIADKLIEGFEIKGFVNTLIAAFLISVIDAVLHWVIPFV